MSDVDDGTLVRRSVDGDDGAFEVLVQRYQTRIFNAVLRIVRDYDDARDVTQSVFVKAFEKLDSFDRRYKFFSWIYRMTVNDSLNTLKRRKPTEGLENESDIRTPVAAPDHAVELQDRVGKALMCLRPDDRAVVVLKHFVSFSYKEIADVLEIPVRTVKSRLFTARERLRDALLEGER